MAVIKEVWTFSSGGATWGEVYYSNKGSLASAAVFPSTLLNARLKLLDPINVLRKIRVSETTGTHASLVIPINLNGIDPDNFRGPAPVNTAIVSTLSSTAVAASRRLWMRGHSIVDAERDKVTGADKLDPDFAKLLKEWIGKLETNGYVVYAKVRAGQQNITPTKLLQIDGTAADGTSIIKTMVVLPVIPGNMIQISQAPLKDFPALNGAYKVLAINGQFITIQYTTPQFVVQKTQTGRVMQLQYVDNATIKASASGFSFIGSRKTKNVNTGSRGARSAKRLRPLV